MASPTEQVDPTFLTAQLILVVVVTAQAFLCCAQLAVALIVRRRNESLLRNEDGHWVMRLSAAVGSICMLFWLIDPWGMHGIYSVHWRIFWLSMPFGFRFYAILCFIRDLTYKAYEVASLKPSFIAKRAISLFVPVVPLVFGIADLALTIQPAGATIVIKLVASLLLSYFQLQLFVAVFVRLSMSMNSNIVRLSLGSSPAYGHDRRESRINLERLRRGLIYVRKTGFLICAYALVHAVVAGIFSAKEMGEDASDSWMPQSQMNDTRDFNAYEEKATDASIMIICYCLFAYWSWTPWQRFKRGMEDPPTAKDLSSKKANTISIVTSGSIPSVQNPADKVSKLEEST